MSWNTGLRVFMTIENMPDGSLVGSVSFTTSPPVTAGKSYCLAQRPAFSSMKTSTKPFLKASNMAFSSR